MVKNTAVSVISQEEKRGSVELYVFNSPIRHEGLLHILNLHKKDYFLPIIYEAKCRLFCTNYI